MQKTFACKCGATFKSRRLLTEHIGLLNPHWPRYSVFDEHQSIPVPSIVCEG